MMGMWNQPPAEPGPGSKDNQIFPNSADRDQPYTWGRADKFLKSSLSGWEFAKLLVLRGKVQDRRIAQHTPPADPDGLS